MPTSHWALRAQGWHQIMQIAPKGQTRNPWITERDEAIAATRAIENHSPRCLFGTTKATNITRKKNN